MIRISQLKLPSNHTMQDLQRKLGRVLQLKDPSDLQFTIQKQSIDARKKPDIYYVYTVDVTTEKEEALKKRLKNPERSGITFIKPKPYQFFISGDTPLQTRPVVVGSGPAGLFCAYMLALNGYRPILLERGSCVEERIKQVEQFWETGILDMQSNVQFGEGGAGTFSDGKLNTLVKDSAGRNKKVLEILIQHGAPEDILYVNKPHIGTDILSEVVKNIRNAIIAHGGEVRFHSLMTDIKIAQGQITQVTVQRMNCDGGRTSYTLETSVLVLAVGHSARDTFSMLYEKEIPMEAKSFAVGVRIEHPQPLINLSQYGRTESADLPAAAYKLATQLESGRGVYTFCMCPGGYVVNASSEQGHLAVNGMSYHARDSKNANSAVIVTVTPDDYPTAHPLSGIAFQRKLEKAAFELGNGSIPLQRFDDFCKNRITTSLGEVTPQLKGKYVFSNVRSLFPAEISASLEQGIKDFDHKINGFARPDALLSGVESRTSSPVRITRDSMYESSVKGLYPCGEGAGYAGGITSAAMDGLKVAEALAKIYHPFD